jgi:hypothetical protein
MSDETADEWLDYIALDWIEDDESLDALLHDVSDLSDEGDASSAESAACNSLTEP